jgi:hypothetical protein
MALFPEMTLVNRNPSANSARKGFVLVLMLFGLTFLVACGFNSSSSTSTGHSGSGFGISSLNGTYVFSSTGLDSSTAPLFSTMVGSLTANGSGSITGGLVDLIGVNVGVSSPAAQPITGGSYSVGTDGRGQIKFDTTTRAGAITITLDFVLISNSHGLVTEYDSNGTGSGTIDLQRAVTQGQLAGSYALSVSGTAANGTSPTATVGAFTLKSNGAISAGQEDVMNAGAYSGAPDQILTKSAVTIGTTRATATIASSAGTSYTFDVYPIDSGHLKFIENDSQFLVSGDAYSQGSSIPTGQLVFTLAGEDIGGLPLDSGGWLTTSGVSITAGLEDFNDAGSVSQANRVSGGFSALSGGRSVLSLSGFVNGAANYNPGTYRFAAYPFISGGGGSGIQLLEIDGLGTTSGAAYAQTSTTLAASQEYGLNLSGLNLNEVGLDDVIGIEEDDIAEFTTTASNLSGLIDIHDAGTLTSDKTLTGSFPATVDSNGRGTASTSLFNFDFYVVNSSTYLLLLTDSQIGTGIFELQNAAGSTGAKSGVFPAQSSVPGTSVARSAQPRIQSTPPGAGHVWPGMPGASLYARSMRIE